MGAVATIRRSMIPADRMQLAVAHAIESLESRVLFAAGDLDMTFGGTGQVSVDFLNRNDFGQAIAVQSDDKVLLAGWVATGTGRGNDFAIARFNPDGSLDATFGTGGKVTTHLGSSFESANAIAVQSDGRIVVAGNTRGPGTGQDFAVVRYNSDGTLDASFGTGGIVRTDLGGLQTDQATAMALTDDGRIVVVGSTIVAGNQQFAAARYTSVGQLDSTFGGGDGIAVHAFANGAGQAKAIATRPDGTMLLAGALYDFKTIGSDFAAIRLFADGSIDSGFGASGWATISMGGVTESAGTILVQDTGRIILVGEFTLNGEQDVALARLTPSGQIDYSFGGFGTGYTVTDFADGIDWATGAVLQADGKIIVGGSGTVSGLYQMAVARYTPNGTPDTRFAGGAGTLTIAFDGATESFGEGGVVLDSQNRLVVGGHVSRASGFDMAAVRFGGMLNLAPTAHAGGPYAVNAGGSVIVSGANSSDADGSLTGFDWDFDYDGSTFDTDATGSAPTFSAANVAGPAMRTIALRVTDDEGGTSIATAIVTINGAPATHAGGSYVVLAGQTVQVSGAGSSDADGFIVGYAWDLDYDGTSFDVDAVGMTTMFAAPAGSAGTTRTIALRCTDNLGAASIAVATVTIAAPPLPQQAPGTAVLVDDPAAPGSKMLLVTGTTGSDVIQFKDKKKHGVEVRIGHKKLGEFSGVTRVIVIAGAGNDVVNASNVDVPVALFGGAGSDYLVGGREHDILVGGDGDDVISGSFGNDVIVGGAGRDVLFSYLGDDLVVTGSLTFEDHVSSMTAVQSEWTRIDRTRAQRIAGLTDGGGNNGPVKVGDGSVIDDNVADRLVGSPTNDWLLIGVDDRVTRLR